MYSVNEPDNYAVEEALQIVDRVGGKRHGRHGRRRRRRGDPAPRDGHGRNHGVLISDEAFSGSDGTGIATILKAFVQKGNYDLILTGVQAEDGAAPGRRDAGGNARLSVRLSGQFH